MILPMTGTANATKSPKPKSWAPSVIPITITTRVQEVAIKEGKKKNHNRKRVPEIQHSILILSYCHIYFTPFCL